LGLGKVYDYLGLRQKALENYQKYLDLRQHDLPRLRQSSRGICDLSNARVEAIVKSDNDFSGDPGHRNGAQFLVKDSVWRDLIGPFLPTDSMLTPSGMKVFYNVPPEPIARQAAALSLKFTIGRDAQSQFAGKFVIRDVRIGLVKRN